MTKGRSRVGDDAARYGEDRKGDAEGEDEGKAPEEIGHGKAGAIDEIDAGLRRRAAKARRD